MFMTFKRQESRGARTAGATASDDDSQQPVDVFQPTYLKNELRRHGIGKIKFSTQRSGLMSLYSVSESYTVSVIAPITSCYRAHSLRLELLRTVGNSTHH